MSKHLPGDFVRGIRLFEGLSREEIQQLLDSSEEVKFAEGATVFEEGGEGRALFVVIEGTVRLALGTLAWEDTELAQVGPQGVFGDSSFFHASPHHATAKCLTPVRLIRLQYSRYRELLDDEQVSAYKLAANAADLLGERLQETDEWIERMLQGRHNSEMLTKWKQFRRGIRSRTAGQAGGFSV